MDPCGGGLVDNALDRCFNRWHREGDQPEGGQNKSYVAKWYLAEKGKEKIKVNIASRRQKQIEMRTVKFIEKDFSEMSSAGKSWDVFKEDGKKDARRELNPHLISIDR